MRSWPLGDPFVRLAAPQGNFVMPDPAPAAVLFLTAGSGITPVISMLRTLSRRGQIADIEHVHSVPTEADALFADELLGQQETVIKGLSGWLKRSRGVSGCTILGDGEVGLILDIGAIVRLARQKSSA